MIERKITAYLESLAYASMAFFSVFLFSIAQVFIVNILFYPAIIALAMKRKVFIHDSEDNNQVVILSLFAVSAILSGIVWYAGKYRTIEPSDTLRMLVQLLFTMQYAVLCLEMEIDWQRLGCWLSRMVFLYAGLILLLFVATRSFRFAKTLLYVPEHRMWAERFIPQWPNVASLPLVFGCYLAFRNKRMLIEKLFIMAATVLTTSRSGVLGVGLVTLYYGIADKDGTFQARHIGTLLKRIIILGFASILAVAVVAPSVLPRLLLVSDRYDITSIGFGLISERPVFGYGGLALDQVLKTGSFSHLHNWILEIWFRYGSLGLMVFVLFLFTVWRRVGFRDGRFMMFVLLLLAFFQIYIRNFAFLMFLLFLENQKNPMMIRER